MNIKKNYFHNIDEFYIFKSDIVAIRESLGCVVKNTDGSKLPKTTIKMLQKIKEKLNEIYFE